MNTDHAHKLGLINNELGGYKVEYENIVKFIIMKPKTFLWQFADGSTRIVSSKHFDNESNAMKYFDKMYENASN